MNDKYRERKRANEASLGTADHYRENWDDAEISLLEGCWGDVPIEEIAIALGRTIEACRQAHYAIGQAMVKRARAIEKKAAQRVDLWTRGFTSLDDMDRYFESP